MIRKLKIRFVALSMTSLLVLLLVIVAAMNAVNYNAVVAEADEVLSLLSRNKGTFPVFGGDKGNRLPPHMSPELPYESRYFSVLLQGDGDVIYAETGRISAVDTGTAIEYAREVFSREEDAGFLDRFRFAVSREGEFVRITFLDCGRQLDAVRQFLYTSAGIALAGFAVVFFVITFAAGRIIRPIAESYEKQKRFITDAGHELKTPLTVISANADVLEMEYGGNEYLADIRRQTKRMAALTGDLTVLARMEEAGDSLPMIDFPLSEVVSDAAASFRTPMQTRGLMLSVQAEPMLSMRGDAKSVEQLVSLLLDNALKYTAPGGTVTLTLQKSGKSILLSVENPTDAVLTREDTRRIFDRFYRADPSRNAETGGHGIGLSVARAIVTAHGGKISASCREGMFSVTAVF